MIRRLKAVCCYVGFVVKLRDARDGVGHQECNAGAMSSLYGVCSQVIHGIGKEQDGLCRWWCGITQIGGLNNYQEFRINWDRR